jgi:hypothetical protein
MDRHELRRLRVVRDRLPSAGVVLRPDVLRLLSLAPPVGVLGRCMLLLLRLLLLLWGVGLDGGGLVVAVGGVG